VQLAEAAAPPSLHQRATVTLPRRHRVPSSVRITAVPSFLPRRCRTTAPYPPLARRDLGGVVGGHPASCPRWSSASTGELACPVVAPLLCGVTIWETLLGVSVAPCRSSLRRPHENPRPVKLPPHPAAACFGLAQALPGRCAVGHEAISAGPGRAAFSAASLTGSARVLGHKLNFGLCTKFNLKFHFNLQGNSNLFETFKIHSKFIYCSNIMKSVLLFF
jgi:hypothetical protein